MQRVTRKWELSCQKKKGNLCLGRGIEIDEHIWNKSLRYSMAKIVKYEHLSWSWY
jgi:hypothetical protein